MSCQGISVDDCTTLASASTTNISRYIYEQDTPPPTVGTEVLPENLQSKLTECDGSDSCRLVAYDFVLNTGDKAESSPYIIQVDSSTSNVDKTDVSVISKVGENVGTTSQGIPIDNLDAQYDPNHLRLTPPISSGPIGFLPLDGVYITGSGTTVPSKTSADDCATSCTTDTSCKGFNFDESSSSCKLFSLVDTEAVVGTATVDNSNTITDLSLILRDPINGLVIGQTVEGLDEYINGPITISYVNSPTDIYINFTSQIAKAIPQNTHIRIKAPTTFGALSTIKAYTYDIDHIRNIGVSGTEATGYDYGYTASFSIQGMNGLPTQTNSTLNYWIEQPLNGQMTVGVNLTSVQINNPRLTSGFLPITKTASGTCSSGLISYTEDPRTYSFSFGTDINGYSIAQYNDQTRDECQAICDATIGCNGFVSYTNRSDTGCCWPVTQTTYSGGSYDNRDKSVRATRSTPVRKFKYGACAGLDINTAASVCSPCQDADVNKLEVVDPMAVKSYTASNIVFQLPRNTMLKVGSVSGSPLTLNAIEFTSLLDTSSATRKIPTDRIIGWTGKITQTGGLPDIPVTVKGYTSTTITFSFSSQSYGTISAQSVELSDSKGLTCQDIKACNASVQRLLDTQSIRSFSTRDLVACSGCNERAYKQPVSGVTSATITKVREYLWFQSSGVFACSGSAPAGTTFDEQCNPVCTKPDDPYADTATYLGGSCQITCRNGLYWNGSACVACPTVTLPANITVRPGTRCQSTCVHSTGTLPSNMILTSVPGTDIPLIPNYTKQCTVACDATTGPPNSTNTRCCPLVTPPTGTTITSYTNDCTTPVCAITDDLTLYNLIASATGAAGPTCTPTCISPTISNSTTKRQKTTDTTSATKILPVKGTAGTSTLFDWTETNVSDSTFKLDTSSSFSYDYFKTNIGTYIFSKNWSVGIYSGNGTPSTFASLASYTTVYKQVRFPFKFKLNAITFWFSSSISQVTVDCYNNEFLPLSSQSIQLTGVSSPQTVSFSNFSFATALRFQVTTNGTNQTIAYKISGVIQEICTTMCVPPASQPAGAYAIYEHFNTQTTTAPGECKMVCPTGYTTTTSGCSACTAATLDPGTGVTFDETCAGTCTVLQPGTSTALTGASAYAGTTTNNPNTFIAGATGTARACHIKACPGGYTMYTAATGTTLSNSGCCPVPKIVDSAASTTDITGTGITWSYPAGSASTSASTGTCVLTCTLPNQNSYGMTVSTDNTNKKCIRSCPASSTDTTVFTESRAVTCQMTCALKTADANATNPPPFDYTNSRCTKTCLSGYAKDTDYSKCCLNVAAKPNTRVTLGPTICNPASSICSVITTNANISGAAISATPVFGTTPYCYVQCTSVTANPGTSAVVDDGVNNGTTGSCALTCSLNPADTNATANPVGRTCTKMCNSGFAKDAGSSSICCPFVDAKPNITIVYSDNNVCRTGTNMCSVTTPNSQNINGVVKITSSATPYCKVDCKSVTLGTGTTASIDDGVSSGTTGSCDFTCALSPADTNARVDKVNTSGVRSCTKTCTSGSMTSAGICCPTVSATSGITVNYNSGDCGFTCTVSDPQRPVIVNTTNRTCTLANYCNPVPISPSSPDSAIYGSQHEYFIKNNVCVRLGYVASVNNYNAAPPAIYTGTNKMITASTAVAPYVRGNTAFKRVYISMVGNTVILVPASSTSQAASPITTYTRSVMYCLDGYWLYYNSGAGQYVCFLEEYLKTILWITNYYADPNTGNL